MKQHDPACYAHLKSLRGSYVEATWTARRIALPNTIYLDPAKDYFDWRDCSSKGILRFSREGLPKIEDHHICRFDNEVKDFQCVEIFNPTATAIRCLCPICFEEHPLGKALKVARIECEITCAKAIPCSVCGSTVSRFGSRQLVPSRFWNIDTSTTEEEIEREMASWEFARVMKDNTLCLRMDECERRTGVTTHHFRRFASHWYSTLGEHIRCHHDEAPPAGWWERFIPISELKPYMARIQTREGHLLHYLEEVTS